MPCAIPRPDLCNDPVRRAEEYVTGTVTEIRNHGHTRDVAIGIAAERLGISPRKVRSLYYAQHVSVPLSLLDRIRVGVVRHMRAEMADLTRKLTITQQKITEMERDMDIADVGHATGDMARERTAAARGTAAALRRDLDAAVAWADAARRMDPAAE